MRVNLLEIDPMKKKRANHERLLRRIENKQKMQARKRSRKKLRKEK